MRPQIDRLRIMAERAMTDIVEYVQFSENIAGIDNYVRKWKSRATIQRRAVSEQMIVNAYQLGDRPIRDWQTSAIIVLPVGRNPKLNEDARIICTGSRYDPELANGDQWYKVHISSLDGRAITRAVPGTMVPVPDNVKIIDPAPPVFNLFTEATSDFETDARGWDLTSNSGQVINTSFHGVGSLRMDKVSTGTCDALFPALTEYAASDDFVVSLYLKGTAGDSVVINSFEPPYNQMWRVILELTGGWDRFIRKTTKASIAGYLLQIGKWGPATADIYIDAVMINEGTEVDPYQPPPSE